jgi:hypothetical protein
MLRKLRSQLSYANVAATLALVLAVGGGTSYAVTKIRARDIGYHAVTGSKVNWNAITASKVKNSSLSGRDLRGNSVSTSDIRNGSLRAQDFAAGQLPNGDKGDKGDPATSIFAAVAADGKLGNSKNVTSNSLGAGAVYTATINQDVSKCAVVATLSGSAPGIVTAQPNGAATPAAAQQITIRTFNETGTAEGRPFQFAVYC